MSQPEQGIQHATKPQNQLSLDEKLNKAYEDFIEYVHQIAVTNSKPARYLFKDVRRKLLDTEILVKAIFENYTAFRNVSTAN